MEELIRKFEEKLGWGDSRSWGRYDFEKLSELIAAETKTTLSVSTLMRVFGKVEYRSRPSVTTLNTLVQFLGYKDWRSFSAWREPEPPPKATLLKPYLLVLGGGIICSLFFYFLSGKDTLYSSEDFSFSSRKVLTTGVPNSVVFDFDATKARPGDSVYISQDWDIRRKVPVNRNDKHHSSIYYFPGYFKAKLLVGSQVVKEHSICIMTDGWLGLTENNPEGEPHYFTDIRDPETGIVYVKDSVQNGRSIEGLEGRWLSIAHNSVVNPVMDQALPENSTIEFDLFLKDDGQQSTPFIQFGLTPVRDILREDIFYKNRFFINLHRYSEPDGQTLEYGLKNDVIGNKSDFPLTKYTNKVLHVAMAVNKTRIRLYLDSSKVIDRSHFLFLP